MLATWGLPPHMSPYFDTLDLGLCLTRVGSNQGKVLVLPSKAPQKNGEREDPGKELSLYF